MTTLYSLTAAQNLNIEAGADTSSSKSSSSGFSATVNVGGIGVGADGSKASSNGTTYTNASINAGHDLTFTSGADTNITGANLTAENITGTVSGDLNLASVQNESSSKNSSFGVNVSTNGAFSGNVANGNANRVFTDNQTSIIGTESVDITVENNTDIKGAVIANIDQNGVDQGNLKLTTSTLTTSDLQDSDKSKQVGISVAVSGDNKDVNGHQVGSGILGNNATGSYDSTNTQGMSLATIGQGEIITGSDISGINRDVANAQVITKKDETHVSAVVAVPESVAQPVREGSAAVANATVDAAVAAGKMTVATASAIKNTITSVFSSGLTQEQTQQFTDTLASGNADQAKALAAKFQGRNLTMAEMMAIEDFYSKKIDGMTMIASLSDEGKKELLSQQGLFFDGTWKDRDNEPADQHSNVAILESLYSGNGASYIAGIGTDNIVDHYVCGAFGCGMGSKIEQANSAVTEKYTTNIEQSGGLPKFLVLDVAGFSRGSATAKAFINNILENGLPDAGISPSMIIVRSEMLFDSVSSIGIPGTNITAGYNFTIPSNVGIAIQANAQNENRVFFPLQSASYSNGNTPANVIQQYFPGVHSDIGGGYSPDITNPDSQGQYNDLGKITLNWMYKMATQNHVPFNPLPASSQPSIAALNSYNNYLATQLKWTPLFRQLEQQN